MRYVPPFPDGFFLLDYLDQLRPMSEKEYQDVQVMAEKAKHAFVKAVRHSLNNQSNKQDTMPKAENPKNPQVYLTKAEGYATVIALAGLIEDMDAHNDKPWTQESRKDMSDIKEAATNARAKICKLLNIPPDLPSYNPGDENEFLTKES